MPRKSVKTLAESLAESLAVNSDNISNVPVSTPTPIPVPVPVPVPESNTKKRAPVKRTNKKIDTLSSPVVTSSSTDETMLPIKINDSVNTFNIHIKHISDDGNNVENTFSTTYTHTSENGDEVVNTNIDSNTSSDSINSDEYDSDGDSDYDKKFTNSSLTLPISSSCTSSILKSMSAGVTNALFDDTNPLYTIQQINYDILIPFVLINMHASSRENIMALLHTTLISCIEGRCITEGFIKPHSTRIIDFKCGKIIAKNVQFNIVIECLVCNPQPQSIITCVAKNITQAGIRAVSDDEYSPIIVYITRDFGIESDKTYYNSIKEGDKINIRVIGKRFEMNDKHIQIIGILVQPKKERIVIATPSHSKKTSLTQPIQISMTETKEESITKNTANCATTTKRAARKIKNPLSIVNDTDNNVITITYDESIDLSKKTNSVKVAVDKESKTTKESKTPKKTKKETGEVLAFINK